MKTELTTTAQIKNYILQNPSATTSEVKKIFGGSRQLISQIFHSVYTLEELKEHKIANKTKHSDEIKQMLIDGKTFVEIAKTLGITLGAVHTNIELVPELSDILDKRDEEEKKRIEDISNDWISGMAVSEMMKKNRLGNTVSAAISTISYLRSVYGEEKFPFRLDNSVSLKSKYELYQKYIAEGKTPVEIYGLLGYNTIDSMRSSMSAFCKGKNNEDSE